MPYWRLVVAFALAIPRNPKDNPMASEDNSPASVEDIAARALEDPASVSLEEIRRLAQSASHRSLDRPARAAAAAPYSYKRPMRSFLPEIDQKKILTGAGSRR